MAGGVSDVRASHVGKPKKTTDDGEVDGTVRGHVVVGGGVRQG